MSIFIKGVDKDCVKVKMDFNYGVLLQISGLSPDLIGKRSEEILDEVVTEVAVPHGRLVDVGKLREKWVWGNTDRAAPVECVELRDIDEAPTIIEPEVDR